MAGSRDRITGTGNFMGRRDVPVVIETKSGLLRIRLKPRPERKGGVHISTLISRKPYKFIPDGAKVSVTLHP